MREILIVDLKEANLYGSRSEKGKKFHQSQIIGVNSDSRDNAEGIRGENSRFVHRLSLG